MSDEHHHHHHLHGSVEPLDMSELDPANQALAEALKISFGVLKLVMLAVVVLFAVSGAYQVQQNEVAVVLRFGKIIGVGEARIKEPGWRWRWPYIEEVVKMPSSSLIRTIDVDGFWYYMTEKEKETGKLGPPPRQLQFYVRDGYTLTASKSVAVESSELLNNNANGLNNDGPVTDYNILHSQWRINYAVVDHISFIERLWDGTDEGMARVKNLLRSALHDAVIITSARRDIDWILGNPKLFRIEVERVFSRQLDNLQVGLSVKLELIDPEPPRQVKASFDRASGARSESDQIVTKARARANEVVNEARAQDKILKAEARAYSTTVINAAAADAEYLQEVLRKIEEKVLMEYPETELSGQAKLDYEQKRRDMKEQLLAITIDQLYHETVRNVIDNASEVIVLQDRGGEGVEMRMHLSRDPRVRDLQNQKQDKNSTATDQYQGM